MNKIREGQKNKITEQGSQSLAHHGSILKEVREAKGISIEAVHDETKIPLDALRAIEEGYSVGTLTPFYVKGFIKLYARFLEIDEQRVLESYQREQRKSKVEEIRAAQIPQMAPNDSVPSHPPIREFDLKQWLAETFNLKRRQQILGVVIALVFFFLLFKTMTFVIGKFSKRSRVKNVTVEKVQKTADTTHAVKAPRVKVVVRSEDPAEAPAQGTAPVPAARSIPGPIPVPTTATSSKNVRLTARANRNSWLSVKADGQVVFQSTLQRGAFEVWEANDQIEISGRNLDQLEFELNGKIIGSLGRKDRKAKKILIRKEGLSVLK